MFKTLYDTGGKLVLIHLNRGEESSPIWAPLPFNSGTKKFEPQSEIDKQLLEEAQSLPEWVKLDLSDRTPTPSPPPAPNWVGILEAVRGTTLFGKVYNASKSSVEINTVNTIATNSTN